MVPRPVGSLKSIFGQNRTKIRSACIARDSCIIPIYRPGPGVQGGLSLKMAIADTLFSLPHCLDKKTQKLEVVYGTLGSVSEQFGKDNT